jgi:hypothetical protein
VEGEIANGHLRARVGVGEPSPKEETITLEDLGAKSRGAAEPHYPAIEADARIAMLERVRGN